MSKPTLSSQAVKEYLFSLFFITIFCLVLTVFRFILAGNFSYWFLAWNLFLAWVPLFASWYLYKRTYKFGLTWSKTNILLFTVWLLFLPNAFYIFTDFIHLDRLDGVPKMYDIVLISCYAINGMLLGYTSLYLVHTRAVQRFKSKGHFVPILALLAVGFAIYLGRVLRWNSWDVLFNPFGLLFDISERFINPTEYAGTFMTTFLFFGFLSVVYYAIWCLINLLQHKTK